MFSQLASEEHTVVVCLLFHLLLVTSTYRSSTLLTRRCRTVEAYKGEVAIWPGKTRALHVRSRKRAVFIACRNCCCRARLSHYMAKWRGAGGAPFSWLGVGKTRERHIQRKLFPVTLTPVTMTDRAKSLGNSRVFVVVQSFFWHTKNFAARNSLSQYRLETARRTRGRMGDKNGALGPVAE